jgi:hypothetical protein
LLLTITPITNSSETVTACGSYFWNDSTYTQTGLHLHNNGCGTDSLLLTITPIVNSSETVTACGNYFWNDSTYTESGLYLHNNGCGTDSLLLTITPITNSSETVTACGSYFWNDSTYTQSGLHLHNNGCGTDSLLLTLVPGPSNAQFIGDSILCYGTPGTLIAAIDNFDDELTVYSWSGPNGFSFEANHANGGHTISNLIAAGDYTCSISNGGSCSVTITRKLRTKQVRSRAIVAQASVICPGQTIMLHAPSDISNPQWYQDMNLVGQLDSLEVNAPGSYYVAYNDSGCALQTPVLSIQLGGPTTDPDLVSGGSLTICSPNNGQSIDAVSGFTYQWFNNLDNVNSISDCRQFEPDSSGTYYYIATDLYGCSAQSGDFSVTVLPGITGLDISTSAANCGSSTGQFNVMNVRGGVAPLLTI